MDNAATSTHYYFENYWVSFFDSYSRLRSQTQMLSPGSWSLPPCWRIPHRPGMVIQADTDDAAKTLIHVNEGVSLHTLSEANRFAGLSAEELLIHLDGQQLMPEQILGMLPTLPGRAQQLTSRIILVYSVSNIRTELTALRDMLYQMNTSVTEGITVKLAMRHVQGEGLSYLVFVDRLNPGIFSQWLGSRKKHPTFFHPYQTTLPLGQEGLPSGVWISDGIRKPFVEALADELRHRSPGTWLIWRSGAVEAASQPFVPLYHFAKFNLPDLPPKMVFTQPDPSEGLRPFQINLELRLAPDATPSKVHRQTRESLARSLRLIKRYEQNVLRQLAILRLLEEQEPESMFEAAHTPSAESSVQTALLPRKRSVEKRIHLFFEPIPGQIGISERWQHLQEFLLNAPLSELRLFRHAYCHFVIQLAEGGPWHELGVHLIGQGNSISTDPGMSGDNLALGPIGQDVLLYQDPQWRSLGCSLYLPQHRILYPPVRPDYPSHGPDAEHQLLFNKLLEKAVFAPGNQIDAFDPSLHTCLIFEYPSDQESKAVVPVFLAQSDFRPLDDAALQYYLNQKGLTWPQAPDYELVTDEIDGLVAHISGVSASQVISDQTHDLEQDIADILSREMSRHLQDVDARLATLAQERDIETGRFPTLVANVQRLEHEIDAACQDLERKADKLEDLLENTLPTYRDQIDRVAVQTVNNWQDFVQQIVSLTDDLRRQLVDLPEPAMKLDQTTARLLDTLRQDTLSDTTAALHRLYDDYQVLRNQARADIEYLRQIKTQLDGLAQILGEDDRSNDSSRTGRQGWSKSTY